MKPQLCLWRISVAALLSIAGTAQAVVINSVVDTDGDGIPDAGGISNAFVALPGVTVPGQAANSIQYLTVPNVFGGGFGGSVTSCLIDVSGCTQPEGVVELNSTSSGAGLVLDVAISVGGDAVESSLSLATSGTANLTSNTALQYTAYEYQQLMFEVTGSIIPSYIPVDIDFSIGAAALDASESTLAGFSARSAAGVSILDLDTWELDIGRFGSVDLVFSASVLAGTGFGDADAFTGVHTVLLRPNTTYGVQLATSHVFTLLAGSYTGLDWSGDALADPVFGINAAWLQSWVDAGNPDLSWSATRVVNGVRPTPVPEPASSALLALGLALIGLVRRQAPRGRIGGAY